MYNVSDKSFIYRSYPELAYGSIYECKTQHWTWIFPCEIENFLSCDASVTDPLEKWMILEQLFPWRLLWIPFSFFGLFSGDAVQNITISASEAFYWPSNLEERPNTANFQLTCTSNVSNCYKCVEIWFYILDKVNCTREAACLLGK